MERGQNPNIIQGRMPVAVVHLLRFGNSKGGATKELAVKFGTTVGKVDDVKKNRNFAYVVEDTRFTQAQIDEGLEWLQRHPKYDESDVDTLVVELEGYTVATDEEAKAFEAARTAARGQPTKTKDGEIVIEPKNTIKIPMSCKKKGFLASDQYRIRNTIEIG